MKQIVTDRNFVAELREDGILHYKFANEDNLEVVDFEKAVTVYQNFGGGSLLKVLAEFPKFSSLDHKTREYLQKREIPAIAEAIVFQGLAQRIIFDAYQLFRIPKYPIKGFVSKKDALNWLKLY